MAASWFSMGVSPRPDFDPIPAQLNEKMLCLFMIIFYYKTETIY